MCIQNFGWKGSWEAKRRWRKYHLAACQDIYEYFEDEQWMEMSQDMYNYRILLVILNLWCLAPNRWMKLAQDRVQRRALVSVVFITFSFYFHVFNCVFVLFFSLLSLF
jgi:hypothetical protein